MSKFKEMKFNVSHNPEVSKQVQQILFGLGYYWYGWNRGVEPVQEVNYVEAPFLYVSDGGEIKYGEDRENFKEYPYQEITIEWMKQPVIKRKTVKVGDKTYDVQELSNFLDGAKNLMPVAKEDM